MKNFILLTFLSIFILSSFEPLYAGDNSKSNAKLYEKPYTNLHKQVTQDMQKYHPSRLKQDLEKYF